MFIHPWPHIALRPLRVAIKRWDVQFSKRLKNSSKPGRRPSAANYPECAIKVTYGALPVNGQKK
jgi:hypothetical protein